MIHHLTTIKIKFRLIWNSLSSNSKAQMKTATLTMAKPQTYHFSKHLHASEN